MIKRITFVAAIVLLTPSIALAGIEDSALQSIWSLIKLFIWSNLKTQPNLALSLLFSGLTLIWMLGIKKVRTVLAVLGPIGVGVFVYTNFAQIMLILGQLALALGWSALTSLGWKALIVVPLLFLFGGFFWGLVRKIWNMITSKVREASATDEVKKVIAGFLMVCGVLTFNGFINGERFSSSKDWYWPSILSCLFGVLFITNWIYTKKTGANLPHLGWMLDAGKDFWKCPNPDCEHKFNAVGERKTCEICGTRNPKIEWECSECSTPNRSSAEVCDKCQTPKPQLGQPPVKPKQPALVAPAQAGASADASEGTDMVTCECGALLPANFSVCTECGEGDQILDLKKVPNFLRY